MCMTRYVWMCRWHVCRMESDILIDKNDQSKIENDKNKNRKFGNSSLNLWCHRSYTNSNEAATNIKVRIEISPFVNGRSFGSGTIEYTEIHYLSMALLYIYTYKDSRIVIESFHRIRPMSNDKNSAYDGIDDGDVCLFSGFTEFGNRRKSVRSNTTHAYVCEFVWVFQSIRDAYTTFWITYYEGNYRKCLTVYLFTHFGALSFSRYVCVSVCLGKILCGWD